MKALNNARSKELFKRYEKPVESPEMLMNALEAKRIATIVGIDLGEIKYLPWFFELVVLGLVRWARSSCRMGTVATSTSRGTR
jgi:hypothetical protein